MPYGLPSAPVRRSITPSRRQYAGSLIGFTTGAPGPPRGGVEPAANHSAFVMVRSSPGIFKDVNVEQAFASRVVCADAGIGRRTRHNARATSVSGNAVR